MKKLIFCLFCIGAFAACATTGEEQTANTQKAKINPEDITLENVVQKSQELRNQVETAKTAYTAAQTVNQATNATGNIGDGLKNQVNKQLDTAKKQLKDEADAWKNVAK